MRVETMQRLRNIEGFNTLVIVLTVYTEKRNEFMQEGQNDYMEKLLTQEQLLKTFPKHIEGLKLNKNKFEKVKFYLIFFIDEKYYK